MAFAYTKDGISIFGTKKIAYGTFTNGAGDYGGDIVTGLGKVQSFYLTAKGTTCEATCPVVNETLPLSNTGGTVSIKTAANTDGFWFAFGI